MTNKTGEMWICPKAKECGLSPHKLCPHNTGHTIGYCRANRVPVSDCPPCIPVESEKEQLKSKCCGADYHEQKFILWSGGEDKINYCRKCKNQCEVVPEVHVEPIGADPAYNRGDVAVSVRGKEVPVEKKRKSEIIFLTEDDPHLHNNTSYENSPEAGGVDGRIYRAINDLLMKRNEAYTPENVRICGAEIQSLIQSSVAEAVAKERERVCNELIRQREVVEIEVPFHGGHTEELEYVRVDVIKTIQGVRC